MGVEEVKMEVEKAQLLGLGQMTDKEGTRVDQTVRLGGEEPSPLLSVSDR